MGAAPGPVRPLSITEVAPGLPVAGPVPSFAEEIRTLHARLQGRTGDRT